MRRKKKIDSRILAGSVIAFLMITSIFGVLFYGFKTPVQEKTNEYNGHLIKYKNRGFVTEIGEQEIFFTTFPSELENIKIDNNTKNLLKQDYFVVTYDPKSTLAEELAIAQYKLFEERLKPLKKTVIRALTNSTSSALPQKTCADATEKNPVIYLEYGNETSITSKDNCVIAKGNSAAGIYQVSDRIAYVMAGVME